jgi:hypothetical protein
MRSIRPYREAVSQRSPGSRACERTLGNDFEFIELRVYLTNPAGVPQIVCWALSSGFGSYDRDMIDVTL